MSKICDPVSFLKMEEGSSHFPRKNHKKKMSRFLHLTYTRWGFHFTSFSYIKMRCLSWVMLSCHFISMRCRSGHRNVCTSWEQLSLLRGFPSPMESINGWLGINKDRTRMYDTSLFKSSDISNLLWVRRIFFGLFSNFWWSFFQLLIPSVFEAIWIFSLDNNSYRSMLHEEPSPFVCSKPEFYCLCVMVPISYIGRDRS